MSGEVETYLAAFVERMQDSLHYLLDIGVKSYEEKPRLQWILEQNAQIGLTGTQIFWTSEVGNSFDRLEEGNENAMKDFNKKQIVQLKELVDHITGDVSKLVRQSIMTIVTIDVHGRDTVHDLVHKGVENAQSFAWQGQLRHRWDDDKQNCFVNCCDAQFRYQYEYLGNVARLVVTPLTDRCYVTLTQAMHLTMGGAPAGPAGTGKTETTKDLGRGLGMMVYVFNCSDQMDYKSTAQIFKGLSMTGAWGCFDEFNRISVEVLSVVSTQYKSILDAIRVRKERFVFQGEEIPLFLSIGAFITMNPGYAGRTELPESLKVLFRPISMCVPDLELICENMLLASGFLDARMLAKKFIVLYRLCKELLSKQDHYDWALRAIKSVLVVAGMLKRQNPHDAEDVVLMRALRDFNTPKIVYEDTPIFMGLINDLFPGLDPPRQRDLDFEDYLKRVLREDKLQTDEGTILKTMQLLELLDVRHCVFVIGYSKVGKSTVINSLAKAITIHPRRAVMNADCGQSTIKYLNAKTVTRNELYGIMSLATREWIDGLVPILMRELSQRPDKRTKFIVFDGDIDAEWIESMNTVMDDNKILTLASNERIPLQHWMRNLIQINDLKVASPATVSRGGVLYINETDIGWMPYVTSWLEAREVETGRTNEKTSLEVFFEGLDPFIEFTRKNFEPSTPISDFSRAQAVCFLLEGLLTEKSVSKNTTKEVYQLYFVYACVWALGGGLDPGDAGKDQRSAFSSWWKGEYKDVKFPESGVVFDYYIDEEADPPVFKPWKDVVPNHTYDAEQAVPYVCVSHAENWALYDLMDRLIERRRPILLIGGAGSGKTVMINQKIRSTMAASGKYCTLYVQMNYFSKAGVIQNTLEGVMEKRTGSIYGPPNQKKMLIFYDDLNLPSEDKYFTQDSIELMRLHLDYGGWYEKIGFTWRHIQDTQPLAAQNPKSGTFFVHGRYQGFFVPLSVGFPQMEVLRSVYTQLFDGVLKEFGAPIKKMKGQLLNATMDIYTKVSSTFLSTAIKFVYNYNLRELSNLRGGLTLVTPEACKSPKVYVTAWIHEVCRVFKDRLISREDLDLFDTLLASACKDNFTEASLGEPTEIYDPLSPPVWAHYADPNAEMTYAMSKGMPEMKSIITDGLTAYNETYAMMDLVLFEDALIHVTKVTRVLLSPSGNMLMVGVGGSGKQSLSRLAASMAAFDTFRMEITSGYGVVELREDFKELYIKAGQRNMPVIFLFTDLQILDEKFLCLFNDYISCGNIPDIIPKEDIDTVLNAQRGELKQLGIQDTRDNLFNHFIEKTRRNLKMVLCFSPVGDGMRVRSQRFSAIVTGCVIDWFQPWPEEALLSVAANFMSEVPDLGDDEARGNVVKFIAYAQTMMEEVNVQFKKKEKRLVYV
jgi:dynein heavy chain